MAFANPIGTLKTDRKYKGILDKIALIRTSLPPLLRNFLFQQANLFSIRLRRGYQKIFKLGLAPRGNLRYVIDKVAFLHLRAFAHASSVFPHLPTLTTQDLWKLILKPVAISKHLWILLALQRYSKLNSRKRIVSSANWRWEICSSSP